MAKRLMRINPPKLYRMCAALRDFDLSGEANRPNGPIAAAHLQYHRMRS